MRLRNWVRSSLRNTGVSIVVACLLSVYYFIMDDEIADKMGASVLERLGMTLLFAMPLCVVLFTISAYKADIPLPRQKSREGICRDRAGGGL